MTHSTGTSMTQELQAQLDRLTAEMKTVKVAANAILRGMQRQSACNCEDRLLTLEKLVGSHHREFSSSFFAFKIADTEFRTSVAKWMMRADANLCDGIQTLTAVANRRLDDIESTLNAQLDRRESGSESSLPRMWEMDELEVQLKRQYSTQSMPVTESGFLASTAEEDECTTPPPTKKQRTQTAPSTV